MNILILAVFITGKQPTLPEYVEVVKHYVREEIIDTREIKYILINENSITTDFNLLHRRIEQLIDAPRLNDICMFPIDREELNKLTKFNRDFKKLVLEIKNVQIHRLHVIKEIIDDTDYRYKALDALRDAKCDFYYVTVRRHGLKKYKDMIGDELYYSGHIVHPVNSEYFKIIK